MKAGIGHSKAGATDSDLDGRRDSKANVFLDNTTFQITKWKTANEVLFNAKQWKKITICIVQSHMVDQI